ncbi:MAG: hypothetical protein ACI959_002270 [Limisphaerales bacterium]|jgi:hypothetical protein
MTGSRVDYINIALMLAACAVAFAIPFELFLFSYAVLGPLHYLTEISWLHKRNYFALKSKDWRILYVAGIAILTFTFFDDFLIWISGSGVTSLDELRRINPGMANAADWMDNQSTGLTFFAFASALIMILVNGKLARFGAYAILAIVGLGLSGKFGHPSSTPGEQDPFFYLLFAIFLPTLIHVYIFTAAFMLFGALKGKSQVGILSVLVLLACGISFFLFRPEGMFAISDYTRGSYDVSFLGLNIEMIQILVPQVEIRAFLQANPELSYIYDSNWGIVITRFIAFAYTYHYLNWFSKTEIIRWHEVPKSWLISIFVLWGLSIALYAYNYRVGLLALYFLSFLHVFLEFPLNWLSFKGIGEELGKRVFSSKSSAT